MIARLAERTFVVYCWSSGAALAGAVLTILGFLIMRGAGSLNLSLIFGEADPLSALMGREQVFDGILPAVAGTFILVLLSVSMALPAGIACGIYFAVFASSRIKRLFSLFVDILASVPSIVIGLFGLALVILLHKYLSNGVQPSLLVSCLALACLVLPYIIRTTELALDGIEPETRLAAIACGASKLENTIHVLIPRSLSGILSGCILAIGRCAEDTAVIMLTGAVASVGLPGSLLGKYEALPFFIYYTSSQYAGQHELAQCYGAAIVLLCVCASLFLLASIIKRRVEGMAYYRL